MSTRSNTVVTGLLENTPPENPSKMPKKDFTLEQIKEVVNDAVGAIKISIADEIKLSVEQLSTKIENLSTSLTSRVDIVEAETTRINKRVDYLEDKLLRNARLCDIVIKGVPFNVNENLNEIFSNISTKICFNTNDKIPLPIMKRITFDNGHQNANDNVSNMNKSIIIAQFIAPYIKEMFLRLYWKQIPIKLIDIGFNIDGYLYMNENLTRKNGKIFREAYSLKKINLVENVFTSSGLVFVRKVRGERATMIQSSEDLLQFKQA